MKCLQKNKIQFDRDLCQNTDKPTLQFLYQRYCAANDIYRQVDQMAKDRTWKGTTITKTEVIGLFVAKTTWHASYRIQFPAAEKHDNMRAWLTEAEDAPSDADLWGDTKDHHTLKDLDGWLKEKAGPKGKAVKKVAKRAIGGGKAKATVSQSSGKGKEKEKEKEEEPKAKRSHKKKSTG